MSKVHVSCYRHDSVPAYINYLQHVQLMRTVSFSALFSTHPTHPHNQSASLSCFPHIQLIRTICQHLYPVSHTSNSSAQSVTVLFSTHPTYPHNELTSHHVSHTSNSCAQPVSISVLFPTHPTHAHNQSVSLSCFEHICLAIFPHMQLTRTITQLLSPVSNHATHARCQSSYTTFMSYLYFQHTKLTHAVKPVSYFQRSDLSEQSNQPI